MLLFFSLTSYPAEIAYFNSPNQELSNGVGLVELYSNRNVDPSRSPCLTLEPFCIQISASQCGSTSDVIISYWPDHDLTVLTACAIKKKRVQQYQEHYRVAFEVLELFAWKGLLAVLLYVLRTVHEH